MSVLPHKTTLKLGVAKVPPIINYSIIRGMSSAFGHWERGSKRCMAAMTSHFLFKPKGNLHDAAYPLSHLKISYATFRQSETAQSCSRRGVPGQKTLQPHQTVWFVLLSVSFWLICVSFAERVGTDHTEWDWQDASTPYPSTSSACVRVVGRGVSGPLKTAAVISI